MADLKFNSAGVPNELKNQKNWILWRLSTDKKDRKVKKVPCAEINDTREYGIDPLDINYHTEFEKAVESAANQNKLFDGIGFVLIKGQGIVCLDIDHCINENGEFTDFAKTMIEKFKDRAYIEVSHSGKGLHIFFNDDNIPMYFTGTRHKDENKEIELYAAKRYIAITGNRIPESATDLVDGCDGLTAELIADYFPHADQSLTDDEITKIINEFSKEETDYADHEVINIMENSTNDTKVKALFFDGDCPIYNHKDGTPDYSLMDFALMMKLLFYTNGNAIQVRRLAEKSALVRDKWKDRPDYLNRTIANAIKFWIKNGKKAFIAGFDKKLQDAKKYLQSMKEITNKTVFNDKTIEALAICKMRDLATFEDFKQTCKISKISLQSLNDKVKEKCKSIQQIHSADSESNNSESPLILNGISFKTPKNYSVNENGVKYTDMNGQTTKICDSAIFIEENIKNVDEGIYKTRLACYLKHEDKWIHTPAVDNEIVANSQKITSLSKYGLPFDSINAKPMILYLRRFRTANAEIIPHIKYVNQAGWQKDGTFVFPNDTASKYKIDELLQDNYKDIFQTKGDIKIVTDLIKQVKEYDIANIAIGTALASPLVEVLGCRNIAVHLYANTESGKTAIEKLAFSLCANPNGANIPTFDATIAGLEYYLAGMKDFLAAIDDLNSAATEKQRLQAQHLPYKFVNEVGRIRAKKTGGNQKTLQIGGGVFTTGEQPLNTDNSNGGSITRLVEIAGGIEIIPKSLSRKIYSVIGNNYGLFGHSWIDCIINNRNEFIDTYHNILEGTDEKIEILNNGLLNAFEHKSPTHIDSIAAITTANILFDKYFLDMKYNEALTKEILCAENILKMMPDKSAIADSERVKPVIINFINSNARSFIGNSDLYLPNPILGVFKDDFVAVFPEPLKEHLRKQGFSPEKVIRELADDGFIMRGSDGKTTQKVRMNKAIATNNDLKILSRMYKIPNSALSNDK